MDDHNNKNYDDEIHGLRDANTNSEISDSQQSFQTFPTSSESSSINNTPRKMVTSPSNYSNASSSTNDYTSCQSSEMLDNTVTEQLSTNGMVTSPSETSLPGFPSLNGDSRSLPSSPHGTLRISPAKSQTNSLKKKIRHFSGNEKRDSTPIPPLDFPVTEDKFIFVHDNFLKSMSVKSIEEYFRKSDMKEDDVMVFQDSEEGGKTALHVLCGTENASINVFHALLNCKHNARLPTYKEDTTLHLAVKKGNNDIVAELMKNYPDMVNYVDKFGFTPVHVAVAYQNEKALSLFLKNCKTIPLEAPKNNLSPIHLAIILWINMNKDAKDSSLSEIDQLKAFENLHKLERVIKTIIKSADLSQLEDILKMKFIQKYPNKYPLHLLAECNWFEIIKLIVEKVDDPATYETLDANNMTPFSLSLYQSKKMLQKQVSMQDAELCQKISERREEIRCSKIKAPLVSEKRKKTKTNQSERDLNANPKQLYLENAKLLLKHMKNNIDAKLFENHSFREMSHNFDKKFHSMTPLTLVLHRDQNLKVEKDIVKMLVEKGAEVLEDDGPILDILSHNYRSDIASLFLDKLTDANKRDKYESTILHYAVRFKDEDNLIKLFSRNADPTLKDNLGRTPLVIAIEYHSSDIYLKSLRKELDRVIENDDIDHKNLMIFFQTHLIAAASISNKEVSK